MAGRIDEAAHEAAVARVGEVAQYHDALRTHLEEILLSPDFRSSRRSQMFLRQVVEHALSGEFESLKERILGISVFDRKPDYDTSKDAIVRVIASDVRRRLKQYYAVRKGTHFRIDLPSGSYIPEFHMDTEFEEPIQALGIEPFEPLPMEVSTFLGDSDSDLEQKESEEISSTSSVAAVTPVVASTSWKRSLILSAVCLLFLVIGLLTGGRIAAPHEVKAGDRGDLSFYDDLLGPLANDPNRPTEIVLSNPHFFLPDGSPASVPPVPGGQIPPHVVKTICYTDSGEAEAAFMLRGLFDGLKRQSHLTEARFLNWETARNHHLIFLGAPYSNEWTNKNLIHPSFVLEHDRIVNLDPLPGEPKEFRTLIDAESMQDFGVIWMMEYPKGSRILVLNALTSAGSEGLGEFFADPSKMKSVYDRLRQLNGGKMPANWQVVVRIDAREMVPLREELVAARVGTANTLSR